MEIFISVIAGYLYATWLEWVLHKYVLHKLGKKKNSWFSFHWSDHHQTCRKNDNKDEAYNKFLPTVVSREILGLYALLIFHLPLYFVSPWFYYTLIASATRYLYVHQKAHRAVEVVYSEPRRFFVKEEEATMIGLVTEITAYFARVLWTDGLWCLESFEDIEKVD